MDALVLGLSLGLAAGISPGPLLALVLTTTLRAGWRAGALAACAPLATDAVIVAAALLVLDNVPRGVLAIMGTVGGLFLVATGAAAVRQAGAARLSSASDPAVQPSSASDPTAQPSSAFGPIVRPPSGRLSTASGLRQAAVVNLLSPHPWVAWSTALGPLVIATGRHRPANAVALVAGFYLTLVGTKVVVAMLVAGGRRRLTDAGYRRALVAAGVLQAVAGLALVVEFAPQLG